LKKQKILVDLPIEDGDFPVRYVSLPESVPPFLNGKKTSQHISTTQKTAGPLSFCGVVLVKKAERLRVAWRKKRCIVAGLM